MSTWTTISDDVLEPGKPIRSVDALALRDNPVAIAAGAANAPRVQTAAIQDAAVTTAKLATGERMTTTNVLNAYAGASLSAVGTYRILYYNIGLSKEIGETQAGSGLFSQLDFPAFFRIQTLNESGASFVAGTWRLVGHTSLVRINTERPAALWLRIS